MRTREEFAAQRKSDQADLELELFAHVTSALQHYPAVGWYNDLLAEVADQYVATYHAEGGAGMPKGLRAFVDDVRTTLDKTEDPDDNTADRISTWLATAILNASTAEAAGTDEEFLVMEWVTMHDEHVRETHADTDRQQRPPGEPFNVGGQPMRYPGDATAPPEYWMGCRCALAPTRPNEFALPTPPTSAVVDAGAAAPLSSGLDNDPVVVAVLADAGADGDSSRGVPGQDVLPMGDVAQVVRSDTQRALAQMIQNVRRPDSVGQEPGHSVSRGLVTQVWHPEVAVSDIDPSVRRSASGGPQPAGVGLVHLGPEAADGVGSHTPSVPKQEEPMDEPTTGPLAWHGVLAPEGVWSGDGRQFKEGALRFRDLPLPLTWQKSSQPGHEGSVVVGKIERIARAGNLLLGEGTFLATPEADEAVGLVAEFGRFGVSVDADEAALDLNEETGERTYTDAQICSAAMVPIPAFAGSFVMLGPWAGGEMEPVTAALEEVSTMAWDGSAGRFTPEQWKKSCVLHVCDGAEKSCHKLPIRDPGGAINPGGVHAAAGRFNQVDAPAEAKAKAKAALRGAYKQIGEEPPDVLKASDEVMVQAGRGPGWVTNPEDTKRLWEYWVHGEGAAKIRWGQPDDFYRCRDMVGEEIGENSPDKLRFLNQICAQWHHDATGAWPGKAPTEQSLEGTPAPVVSLVASVGVKAPRSWFQNPEFAGPTPFRITDEGQVFGHIAQWGACHISYPGECVAPPRSTSGYAYFLTGYVVTDDGDVPTGPLTIGGGHAHHKMGMRAAAAHYDNTTTAVCDVTCGEDEWGIWVAGWVRPGASEENVVAMRASAPSGDWRELRPGQLEMIAALSVNTPGFVTPRVGIANGHQVSLVAAGRVVANDDFSWLVDAVTSEINARFERKNRMATLAAPIVTGRRETLAALAQRVGGQ